MGWWLLQFYSVIANMRGDSPEAVAGVLLTDEQLRGLQGPTVSPVYTASPDGSAVATHGYYACVICVNKKRLYPSVKALQRVSGWRGREGVYWAVGEVAGGWVGAWHGLAVGPHVSMGWAGSTCQQGLHMGGVSSCASLCTYFLCFFWALLSRACMQPAASRSSSCVTLRLKAHTHAYLLIPSPSLPVVRSASCLQLGGSGVLVQPMTYIFDEEPARWQRLLRQLGLEEGAATEGSHAATAGAGAAAAVPAAAAGAGNGRA
jgi:hypothetical protein